MGGLETRAGVKARCTVEQVASLGHRIKCAAWVWDSGRPGPTVLVTANVHGDEVTGVAAVHALEQRLEHQLIAGRVVGYPSLNPAGLRARTRTVAVDGVDLNRCFPGEERRGGAHALAAQVWAHMMGQHPNLLIDLHADSMLSVPYAIVDPAVRLGGPRRAKLEAELLTIARATGLMVVEDYADRTYLSHGLDRSLTGAMVNHAGVPAITLEVGPRRALDLASVDITLGAVLRLLAHKGMLERPPHASSEANENGGLWRRSPAPKPMTSGLLVPRVKPGQDFEEGQALAEVRDVLGTVQEVLRAPGPGRVVTWTSLAWVEPQDSVGMLGLAER